MGVRVVHRKKERLVGCPEERFGLRRVRVQVLPPKVAVRNAGEVERKRRFRIHVQFADDAGPVARPLQAPDDVGRLVAVEAEAPGRQADLSVLMRIEARQQRRARLAAAGLGHVGVLEEHAGGGERVKVRRPGVPVAVRAQFRAVVFGDDQQDVRLGGLNRLRRCVCQRGQRQQQGGPANAGRPGARGTGRGP